MKQKLIGFLRLLLDYIERFGLIRGTYLYFHINPPSRFTQSKPELFSVSAPFSSSLLYLRRRGSDPAVFNQIFVKQQYLAQSPFHEELLQRKFRESVQIGRVPVILDLGANIGLAARWFDSQFSGALIYSVEPDAKNFEILKKNVAGRSNIVPLHAAVWSHEGKLLVLNSGRESWAVQVAEIGGDSAKDCKESAQGVSVAELLRQFDVERVFILKIDVEGAETAIFSGDTDWLSRTSVLIIELHDRLSPFQYASLPFFRAISRWKFDFLISGENLFFFLDT